MADKILFVDDEPNVLEAFRRQLGLDYEIETASNGREGLAAIRARGPFAVIIADMRMPEMDGIAFLREASRLAPGSVRMMLTGNADMQTAIDSINNGNIFRFLTKPCPPNVLENNLKAGIKQYNLELAEQELLSKTLVGAVQVLTEILSSSNPAAFLRATRVARLMDILVKDLGMQEGWRYQLAAMLSQVGLVGFPPELLSKIHYKEHLTKEDERLIASHPQIARRLLEKIPRLELIGRMIENQQTSLGALNLNTLKGEDYTAAYGGNMLKTCLDYDALVTSGMSHELAIGMLNRRDGQYRPEFIEALERVLRSQVPADEIEGVKLEELEIGMTLVEGLWDYRGNMVAPAGSQVTHTLLMQVYSQSYRPGALIEPIKVLPVK
jgi:response regulator RpfG family c-di-GMP phosphodiesterase